MNIFGWIFLLILCITASVLGERKGRKQERAKYESLYNIHLRIYTYSLENPLISVTLDELVTIIRYGGYQTEKSIIHLGDVLPIKGPQFDVTAEWKQ